MYSILCLLGQNNTYSANTSILENHFVTYNHPAKERGSERKIPNYKFMSIMELQNKKSIRPFSLLPQQVEENEELTEKEERDKKSSLLLPEIFSKDSVLPSTNESDFSLLEDKLSYKS